MTSTTSTSSNVSKKRSRWDETPDVATSTGMSGGFTATPVGGVGMATPVPGQEQMTSQQIRTSQEMLERNRPLTDEELDAMFPSEGYKIVEPPASYVPIRTCLLYTSPSPRDS